MVLKDQNATSCEERYKLFSFLEWFYTVPIMDGKVYFPFVIFFFDAPYLYCFPICHLSPFYTSLTLHLYFIQHLRTTMGTH